MLCFYKRTCKLSDVDVGLSRLHFGVGCDEGSGLNVRRSERALIRVPKR